MADVMIEKNMVVAPELNNKKYLFAHGSKKFKQIYQQTGNQTVTLTANTGQTSTFQIDPDYLYLYDTHIRGTFTPPAIAAKFNWVYIDGFNLIKDIRLTPAGAQDLFNITDLPYYLNMTSRRNTKIEDVLSNDRADHNVGIWQNLQPPKPRGGTEIFNRPTVGGLDPDVVTGTPGLEPRYLTVGGSAAAQPVLNFSFPLSDIFDSIGAIKQAAYFGGQTLYLVITWNNLAGIMYAGDSDLNPTTVPAAPTGNGTISNLSLYCGVEMDQAVKDSIRREVESPDGLKMLIPYIYYEKLSRQATTNDQLNVFYKPGQGKTLQKIYWAPYNATNTGANSNNVYNHSCLANLKVNQFNTQIDGNRLQPYDLRTATFDDYLYHREKLRGSSLLSSDEYYYNWVWVEDFSNNFSPMDLPRDPPLTNCHSGLDLTQKDIRYTVDIANLNNAVPINHYIYGVTQRMLVIKPNQIYFEDM